MGARRPAAGCRPRATGRADAAEGLPGRPARRRHLVRYRGVSNGPARRVLAGLGVCTGPAPRGSQARGTSRSCPQPRATPASCRSVRAILLGPIGLYWPAPRFGGTGRHFFHPQEIETLSESDEILAAATALRECRDLLDVERVMPLVRAKTKSTIRRVRREPPDRRRRPDLDVPTDWLERCTAEAPLRCASRRRDIQVGPRAPRYVRP
jgi:hypothetical protein